jgi:hypothetical protein
MLPIYTKNITTLYAAAMAIMVSGFAPITVGAEQPLATQSKSD